MVVGREYYIDEMNDALKTTNAEFIAVTGRRRVGKTFLIGQVYQNKIDFELTGLFKGDKKEQIENFNLMLEEYFPKYKTQVKPSTWLVAFSELKKALIHKNKKSKMVVFIDELPWLSTKRSGFLTGLTWFWNSWAVKQNIILVVSGSAASWMINHIISDKGGLHNRVTRLLKLRPFNLYETEKFLQSKKINLNQFQISQIYITLGGIPMYLNMIKNKKSAIQNIQALCFDVDGFFNDEFDRLFSSLFENHENHIHIVDVLSKKKMGMTRQEIIEKSNRTNGGMLSKILKELRLSGFIEEYGSLGKIHNDSLYRLTDPYTLFYLTYIRKISKKNQYNIENFSDLPSWKAWSGYAFENLCLLHISQIKAALSIKGMATSVSSFIAKPKHNIPGAQIDLLIDRKDNCINVCEMKYATNKYLLTKSDIKSIDEKKQVLMHHSKTKKHLYTTLITTHSIVENEHSLNGIDQIVLLEDLFVNE
jgi:uncharacterized protein